MHRTGEALFEGLLESAPDAIVIANRDGQIVLVNSQTEKIFGYGREELLGHFVEILLPECSRETHVGQRRNYTARPHTRPMGARLDLAGRRKDGAEFPVEVSLSPLETEEGLLVTAFIRDVTDRKIYERVQRDRDMLRAEQLAALGQVAAGVAHELRNPLTSIKGLVQVNRRELEARGLPAEDLGIIEQEIRRMERTLQTFLDFARPPHPQRRLLELEPIAERVFALIGGRAEKQQVTLRFLQPASAICVEADEDQIQQLLLNLVLNALDAMPHGGSLEVALRLPRDGQVELQVRDSGPGIAPHLLPKVFDPFVSSKETGLGLGLAVSRRVAEGHGGQLAAFNRQEGGACFVLTLVAATNERADIAP